MQDVTDLMNSYRECSRNLWNTYFGTVKDPWALASVYDQIRKLLFEALVARRIQKGSGPMPVLIVAPMESLPILVRRLSSDRNYYWDQEPDLRARKGDGIQLRFVDYYDFFEEPIKDFRFYRCQIVEFPGHSEYQGREALVDVADAKVFCDKSTD